jgi:hypothetical protein
MARKFITSLELDFIHRINNELIQRVVGQEVFYYAISTESTRVVDIYNESIRKTWNAPVSINARVRFQNENTTSTQFGQDSKYLMEVEFHTHELIERNVVPKEGDFIEFGQIFFEISSVTKPQLVFGQVQDRIMTKCVCTQAREGQFQAGADSSHGVDNTHPIENSVCKDE